MYIAKSPLDWNCTCSRLAKPLRCIYDKVKAWNGIFKLLPLKPLWIHPWCHYEVILTSISSKSLKVISDPFLSSSFPPVWLVIESQWRNLRAGLRRQDKVGSCIRNWTASLCRHWSSLLEHGRSIYVHTMHDNSNNYTYLATCYWVSALSCHGYNMLMCTINCQLSNKMVEAG